MNEIVKTKLAEIVKRYGTSIIEDAPRIKAMLLDLLKNENRKEINILITSIEEGIPKELSSENIPIQILIPKLINKLKDNRAMENSYAEWAVETWAHTLGINYEKNTPKIENKVNNNSLESSNFSKLCFGIQVLISQGNFSQAVQIIKEQESKEINSSDKIKLYDLKVELESKKDKLYNELEKEFKSLEETIIPILLNNQKYVDSNEILYTFSEKAYKAYEPDGKKNGKFIFSENIYNLQKKIAKAFAKNEIKNLEIDIENELDKNNFDRAKDKLRVFENKLFDDTVILTYDLIQWNYISISDEYYETEPIRNKIKQSSINYSNTSSAINNPLNKIIIIGLIATICLIFIIPIYNNNVKLGKRSIVKSNMHSLQTTVETYGVDHEGTYPENIEELFKEAKKSGYFKEFKNPYGNNLTQFGNYGDISIKGMIIYQPIKDSSYSFTHSIVKYKIFGYDEENNILKDKNNLELILINN